MLNFLSKHNITKTKLKIISYNYFHFNSHIIITNVILLVFYLFFTFSFILYFSTSEKNNLL